ncbi:MAG: penicillin-binding protein 2, partial [Nitrospirae bacterium RBG_19FT_COMBO_42_15]
MLEHQEDLNDLQRRFPILIVFVILTFLILVIRIGYLQLIKSSYFRELSESNRLRSLPIEPYRGLIFDRNGELLAHNVPGFHLSIILEDLKNKEATIKRVTELIGISEKDIKTRLSARKDTYPFAPVRIKENISRKEVAVIEANKLDIPGVVIEAVSRREYRHGNMASHLLGYVGEITQSQLDNFEDDSVYPGITAGQDGIEKTHDPILRGIAGYKQVEVDAYGHEMNIFGVKEPVRGNDIYLAIDASLQKIAEDALGNESGAVVAIDTRSGDILVMASHPVYDHNLLSKRLNAKEWEALVNDPSKPLNNRAIQGVYPPGSVFKIVTAAAAIEAGAPAPEDRIFCKGGLQYGRRFYRDWKAAGHGSVALHRAIVESCDVYFYNAGITLGVDRIADYAFRLGLGSQTGIDLPSEKAGLIPTTSWKLSARKVEWIAGETLSVAIGQGYVLTTPMQLAMLISSVANSGVRYQPNTVWAVKDRLNGEKYRFPPVEIGRVEIKEETFQILRNALRGVVNEQGGTAGRARSAIAEIGGKTGTAQVVALKPNIPKELLKEKRFKDHALFVAFAPVSEPRIAVAVIVEHGGKGSAA